MSKELTADTALALALRPLATKALQTAKIAELLGPNRTVRCYRDPSSTAKYPRLTGVEFLNVTVTGAIGFNGGAIVSLGNMITTNKNVPVDIGGGTSVLVMEGNGHYIQGSLGLTSDFAFNFSANMFAGAGVGFDSSSVIQAYAYKASGIGPAAPVKTRAMAHILEGYDFTDPLSPVLAWTNYLSKRINDFSYQDAEMATENGDSAVWCTPSDSTYGSHLFGATLTLSDPSTTMVGNVVQQCVVVGFAHDGSWSGFPIMDSYNRNLHKLSPEAFKIVLKDMDGNVLNVFQMHDGQAINTPWLRSADIGQGTRDGTHPLQPKFNVFEQLVWVNTQPKQSVFSNKLHPGMRNWRESMSKVQSSMNSVEPLITGGYDGYAKNALSNPWYARKWPEADVGLTINDPYLDSFINSPSSSAYHNGWYVGWGYEPGAFGCHNWYTSPGAPRNDRCPIATMLVRFINDPTGVRVQENAANLDMAFNWTLNYYNHSCYYTPSPSVMMHPATNADMLSDKWAFQNTYYGAYGRDNQISLNGDQRGGTGNDNYDIDGNMASNAYADDPLHDYGAIGMPAMIFTMPMLGLSAKFHYFKSRMLHQNPFGAPDLGVRTMAWDWLQTTIMWKNASTHPYSITQKEIEDFFAKQLEALYAAYWKPAYVDLNPSGFYKVIRNFGLNAPTDNGNRYLDGGGRLGMYMGEVLRIMRQTGLWHRMRTYGGNCEASLLYLVRFFDTFAFGNMVQAKGVGGVYFSVGDGVNASSVPDDWAGWYAQRQVPDANGHYDTGDFIHVSGYDDNHNWYDRAWRPNPDVSWNNQSCYIYMRKHWFPEITHPLLDSAYTACDGYDTQVANYVAAQSGYDNKRNSDYVNRHPGIAPVLHRALVRWVCTKLTKGGS